MKIQSSSGTTALGFWLLATMGWACGSDESKSESSQGDSGSLGVAGTGGGWPSQGGRAAGDGGGASGQGGVKLPSGMGGTGLVPTMGGSGQAGQAQGGALVGGAGFGGIISGAGEGGRVAVDGGLAEAGYAALAGRGGSFVAGAPGEGGLLGSGGSPPTVGGRDGLGGGGGRGGAGGAEQGGLAQAGAAGSEIEGGSQQGGEAGEAGEAGTGSGKREIVEELELGQVFSGHPVKFALATVDPWQFAAYYADDQRLTVASRQLDESTWNKVVLDETLGWDSHNYVAMAVDQDGYVHVSANMHGDPLVYYRTKNPHDIDSFETLDRMVGSKEEQCTYPEFFRLPSEELVFAYRDGSSGSGNHIFNIYDASTQAWHRLLDQPLTDGESERNAYPVGPILGPDGYFHLVWVWRDTPDADTNHDLSYARSRDLVSWETAAGVPLTVPITLATSDIVDPVPVQQGMINNNTKVGFDSRNRPVVVYHKYDRYDGTGNTQLYNARFEDGAWVVHQTSDWDYRWDFGGNGTLVFAIEVEGVKLQPDGTLTQLWYHSEYGGWNAFRVNEDSLQVEAMIEPPLPYPSELDIPESTTEGMVVRWQADWGTSPDPSLLYMLRWETLESNRDQPRDPVPPSTTLRLYSVRQ